MHRHGDCSSPVFRRLLFPREVRAPSPVRLPDGTLFEYLEYILDGFDFETHPYYAIPDFYRDEVAWHDWNCPEEDSLEMVTFLPYPNYTQTARCLDDKRLGKQRVECHMIIDILCGHYANKGDPTRRVGYINHPATKMWRGSLVELQKYYNELHKEWTLRGFVHNGGFQQWWNPLDTPYKYLNECQFPPWMGYGPLHASHRATLLAKNYGHYSQFGWSEEPEYGYWWPVL